MACFSFIFFPHFLFISHTLTALETWAVWLDENVQLKTTRAHSCSFSRERKNAADASTHAGFQRVMFCFCLCFPDTAVDLRFTKLHCNMPCDALPSAPRQDSNRVHCSNEQVCFGWQALNLWSSSRAPPMSRITLHDVDTVSETAH